MMVRRYFCASPTESKSAGLGKVFDAQLPNLPRVAAIALVVS